MDPELGILPETKNTDRTCLRTNLPGKYFDPV